MPEAGVQVCARSLVKERAQLRSEVFLALKLCNPAGVLGAERLARLGVVQQLHLAGLGGDGAERGTPCEGLGVFDAGQYLQASGLNTVSALCRTTHMRARKV